MADRALLAMLQQMLGGITAQERTLLLDELARRIILSGVTISNTGVWSLGVPTFAPSAIANLGAGTIGDLPYFDSGSTLAKLSDVATGKVLTSGGVGAAPSYAQITNSHVDPAAAIGWSKLDKTGSSLADLTTRSATDLSSGTLAAARGLSVLTTTSIGTQNDFNPGSLTAPIVMLRCNNASLLTLNGIVAGSDGQVLVIESIGAGQVDLAHQNVGSLAANRLLNIATSGNSSLAAGVGTAIYQYDGTTARWRLVAHEQGAPIAFTPGLTFGGASTGMTFGAQQGAYTLRGRVVYFQGRLTLTAKGSALGNAQITALPFTAHGTYFGVVPIPFYANMATITTLQGYISSGSTVVVLTNGGAAAAANLTDANFGATSDLIFNGQYSTT